MLRDRLVKIDIFRALDSFRRDLKRPGKKERDWETENYEQHHKANCPIWNFKKRKDLGRDLNEQPGDDRVGNGDLVDITSFKLSEEIPRIRPIRHLACYFGCKSPRCRSWQRYFGASEATILSKRGPPRSGAHSGWDFKRP